MGVTHYNDFRMNSSDCNILFCFIDITKLWMLKRKEQANLHKVLDLKVQEVEVTPIRSVLIICMIYEKVNNREKLLSILTKMSSRGPPCSESSLKRCSISVQ